MPPKAHAVLSASSSHRWLNCPPSARLCESYEDTTSDFAAEGTDAHALCEYKLKKLLGIKAKEPTENLTWYSAEMEDCAESYAGFIAELLAQAKETCLDPLVLIEQRVDFSKWVSSGFGTADCIIIADGAMNIIDYKHGQGVEVSAVNNPQMKLYALGALELFDGIYDINTVRMTIFQPRKSNVSTDEITKDELLYWADTELSEMAKMAYDGEGDFKCGDWCRFCKAKNECRERARANLELARYDFEEPPLLNDTEIAYVLTKVDELTSWANDVKEYALKKAISGKEWTGFKLVEGRSNRKYTDETIVASVIENAGFDPYEKKIIGITAMQKILGKAKFDELLSSYIEKPQGKPTLVPESDKRPVYQSADKNQQAKNDFMEEK